MKPRTKALLLPLVLGACVQSVHPLHTDDTIEPVPALIGTWVAESGDVLAVTTADSLSYTLTLLDQDGAVSRWVGHVTRLAGRRWLSVRPAALPDEWSDEYRDAYLPVHQFWALQRVDSVLVAASLVYDSLTALLKRDPGSVAHTVVGSDVLLTAETPVLRTFVAAFADRPGTLEESEALHRVPRRR